MKELSIADLVALLNYLRGVTYRHFMPKSSLICEEVEEELELRINQLYENI